MIAILVVIRGNRYLFFLFMTLKQRTIKTFLTSLFYIFLLNLFYIKSAQSGEILEQLMNKPNALLRIIKGLSVVLSLAHNRAKLKL